MHDANGTPLKVGDKVMLEGTILEVYPSDDFCNVKIRPRPMRGRTTEPEDTDDMSSVNTGQLVLLERAPEAKEEPAPPTTPENEAP